MVQLLLNKGNTLLFFPDVGAVDAVDPLSEDVEVYKAQFLEEGEEVGEGGCWTEQVEFEPRELFQSGLVEYAQNLAHLLTVSLVHHIPSVINMHQLSPLHTLCDLLDTILLQCESLNQPLHTF